jgi:hypothetical protein
VPAAFGAAVVTPTRARLRSAATLYLGCVLALAVGGAVLGARLLQTGAAENRSVHLGPPGLGVPAATSFGSVEVESVAQILGLTPKALAGMTHGIHSLVKADQMQVQLVLALRNRGASTTAYDPARFQLALVRAGRKTRTYPSVSTSVRTGELAARSAMETTIGFVVPRFNPKGTRLSLRFREPGRAPVSLDLGPVRSGGSLAAVRAALKGAHQH